jgi:hypothetical protein
MKIHGTEVVVERTGATESKGFAIKASAQAFRILSDGLYSDKVKAVVRELSSNAWDAHIQAGTTDTPFLVHLPNNIEPWFSIRDYGIGLAHDKVMGLYSTYFDSTKDESNDFTGAMGLGSKSPFSYTDAFTVTSYYNGEKRVYMIDIGSEGVPSISLVGSSGFATDEHNGLEIKMAVKKGDFGSFRDKAQDVYRWYPLLPKVIGTTGFYINKVEYLFKGNGWKLIKGSHRSYAVQGTVAYPIRAGSLQGVDDVQIKVLDMLSVQIDFEIGELEVSASREDLGYDERTSRNIIAKVDTIVAELKTQANDRLAACKSLWEAAIEFDKMKSYPALRRLIESGAISPTWNGNALSNNKNRFIKTSSETSWASYSPVMYRYKTQRVMRKYHAYTSRNDMVVTPADDAILAINDINNKGLGRFREYVNNATVARNSSAILFTVATPQALGQLREELGVGADYTFLLASDMPEPPKKKRVAVDKSTPEIIEMGAFNINASTASRTWKPRCTVDVSQGGVFVRTFKGETDSDSYNFEVTNNLAAITEAAIQFKLISVDTRVYGVPRSHQRNLSKHGAGCKDLFEMVHNYINKQKDALKEKIDLVNNQHAFNNSFVYRHDSSEKLLSRIVSAATRESITLPTDVTTFVDSISKGDANVTYINHFQEAAALLKIELDMQKADSGALRKEHDALLKRYPMIKHVDSTYLTHESLLEVIAYVKSCNN